MTHPQMKVRLTHALLGLLTTSVLAGCGAPGATPASPDLQLEAGQAGLRTPVAPQKVSAPLTGGWVIQDQAASDGSAVALLGTADVVSFQLPRNLKAGEYTVSVVGRGELYLGAPVVSLSGAEGLLGTVTLDNTAYDKRTFGRATLRPGATLTLTFLNDEYGGPGMDRNVVVDYLLINQSKSGL